MRNILLLCLLTCLLSALRAQKPQVLIITTGGTIASQTNAALIEGNALIQAVPQLLDYANIEVFEIFRTGSSKMTPDNWLLLLKYIDSVALARPEISCIVITHGTDTMEETAFFLNLTHKHSLPVVLTGSMRSSNEISADGPANLIQAVRTGIHPESRGKGVLVVLNENISSGSDLIKMHNRRADTFGPGQNGYLGFVAPDTIIYYRNPLKPHTVQTPFDVRMTDRLPKVELVADYAGFDQSILDYFYSRDNQGLVVSTFAGGRISGGMTAGLRQNSGASKPVVLASGIKSGWISGNFSKERPFVVANDLPPNKARILLMLALLQTKDAEKIQHFFRIF